MFNKLKQIKELRDKAKEIQSALSQVVVDIEHKGINVQMDGNQQVRFIKISDALMADKVKLEVALADAMNESIKKVQKEMAMHLQKMGNLDLPGLS